MANPNPNVVPLTATGQPAPAAVAPDPSTQISNRLKIILQATEAKGEREEQYDTDVLKPLDDLALKTVDVTGAVTAQTNLGNVDNQYKKDREALEFVIHQAEKQVREIANANPSAGDSAFEKALSDLRAKSARNEEEERRIKQEVELVEKLKSQSRANLPAPTQKSTKPTTT